MRLSRHVVQTTDTNSRLVYFNTVTRKSLPLDSPEEQLRQDFFLAGQEEQALQSVYDQRIKRFSTHIITTRQCNLRCPHCLISHELVAKEDHELDIPGIVDFIRRYTTEYKTPLLTIHFSGGENLLVVDRCLEIMRRLEDVATDITYHMVTNLTVELTDKHFELFRKLTNMAVSIDGLEDCHNNQRLPLDKSLNAYQATIANLKKLVFAGLKDKLIIQACVDGDKFTVEDRRQYYETMIQFGVQKVLISRILPTIKQPAVTASYTKALQRPKLTTQRCCKYRVGMMLIDYDGNVTSDYYSRSHLGTIYDSVDTINQRQMELNATACVFSDPKCRECPAVGYCWGGCTSSEVAYKKLSDICDQAALIEHIQKMAADGKLA